jgi:ubiquinone/menaquinone biosynthesis C-methylase UbiE
MNIPPASHFNEEGSRRTEALYQTPDVVAQRREVLRALELLSGERVLDIGSGPGLLALEMAVAVGPSGKVSGIDSSDSMINIARARCADQHWVEFQSAEATKLPFPDGSFDAAVSTQVYEYVSDITAALAELHRVLRPGGRALILDTDWDSLVWHTTDRARMERIRIVWEAHVADPRLPRTLSPKLKRAGLLLRHREVIPIFNPEYNANSYSYGMIDRIAKFVAGRQGISRKEAAAWAEDLRNLGETGSYFFSLNRYLFLAAKPET